MRGSRTFMTTARSWPRGPAPIPAISWARIRTTVTGLSEYRPRPKEITTRTSSTTTSATARPLSAGHSRIRAFTGRVGSTGSAGFSAAAGGPVDGWAVGDNGMVGGGALTSTPPAWSAGP